MTLAASVAIPAPMDGPKSPATPGLAAQVTALASAVPAVAQRGDKDSLKNGAIIGGVVGAAAMGGFIYTLCRAMDDTGGQTNCGGPALIWGGIAGAAGAAVGAGVDALFDQQSIAAPRKARPGFTPSAGVTLGRVRF